MPDRADATGRRPVRRPARRPERPTLATLVLAVLVALGGAACTGSDPPEQSIRPGPESRSTDAVVASVTDGDTVRVDMSDGRNEPVRFIGIDTPETRDPRVGVECFGREASAQTEALIPVGTPVRLEFDVEQRDRYDRVLAYVYRASDGLFVNESLVAGGWATPYRFPPNVRYADRFSDLGAQARAQGLGLWGTC